jgi:hypothetical protein
MVISFKTLSWISSPLKALIFVKTLPCSRSIKFLAQTHWSQASCKGSFALQKQTKPLKQTTHL